MIYLKAIIQFMPELINLIKTVSSMMESGIETIQIKKDLKRIDSAFKKNTAKERARALNDAFSD